MLKRAAVAFWKLKTEGTGQWIRLGREGLRV